MLLQSDELFAVLIVHTSSTMKTNFGDINADLEPYRIIHSLTGLHLEVSK